MNSIRLGIELDNESNVEGRLNSIIETLNSKKIELDINIKDSNIMKQLESLTDMINKLKSDMGEGISLNGIDKAIDSTTQALERQQQVLTAINNESKISETKNAKGDVIKSSTTTPIDFGTTQTDTVTQKGTNTTIVTDLAKQAEAINKVSDAMRILESLESNGFVGIDKINQLKTSLDGVGNDKQLGTVVNQIKELTSTEATIMDYTSKMENLRSSLLGLKDARFDQVLGGQGKEALNAMLQELNEAQVSLKNFDGINLNGLKQSFNDMNKEISSFASATINAQREAEKLANIQAKDDSKNKTEMYKNMFDQIAVQEKQAEAFQHIDSLKQNGIVSDSDIAKLEKAVQEARTLAEVKSALGSIMNTSMMNESSIVSISKQLDDAQLRLDKMKQTFGSKLPNGFIESTQAELNKFREDLTQVDSMGFNGIRNSLNGVTTNMKEVTSQTQQLISAERESNSGGFFSGITDFLAKAGLFYGVAQAVQEVTQQMRNAYEYAEYLDKAFTDMTITMDLTKSQFTDMTSKIQEMGVAYGNSSKTVMDIARVYSNANTDIGTIMEKIKPDLWLANVSRMNGDEVTKTIQSVTNQFRLMSKEGMTAEQATEKVGNSLVTVSKNMAYDFTAGIKQLTEAVNTSGSVAEVAGQSMDSYLSMAGAFIEATGKTGSEFANSYKMIASRVLQQGSLAQAVGTTTKEMADAEEVLKKYNISIRDGEGGLRSLDSILLDVSKVWVKTNDGEKQFIANKLAGVRQSASFVSIIESMAKQQIIYNKTQTETSSLYEAQQKYAESLEGRLGSLKATYEALLGRVVTSDFAKILVTDLTSLLNVIGTIDGKTITYIATIGTLAVTMSKLVAINRELMAVQEGTAVATGFTNLLGVLTGMTPLMTTTAKSIGEATHATEALMLLQGEEATVAVAETAGLTGLSGAFTLLKTGIMEAMEASIAFMATPIGMAISAIAVAVGIAIGSFALYQQHQAELTDNAKKLKEAVDLANDAISHGDIKSAGKELGDIKDQQDKLESLIATKKKLDDMPESNFFDKVGGASKAQSIALVQKQIDDLTDSYTKQGLTVDEQTGKIEQYVNAQHAMADAQDVEKIKEKTKAQIEDRMNLESAQEEYNSFISTSQDLYSEYQNLSSQENLSAEQKQRLGEVCDELQGRFTDLNVSVDENGVAHINNTPLIEDNISYLTSEGMTVDTLTSIRMADSKACSEWSVNNQNMTYAEVCANIENYKTEIDALRKLAEARSAQKSDPNFFGPFPENDGIDDQIKDLTDKENGALAVKNRIDEIYGSIKPPTRGGGGYSTSGVDAEPKASKAKGGSTGKSEAEKEAEKAQKEAEKYAEQISNTKVDIKTDRYFSLNGVLEKINGQLTLNKTLQDATTGEEHYKAIEQEIELYKQKQDALTKLNAEQEKEKNEIKDYLSQYSFYFDATTGEMLNSQTRLQELQDGVNAMGGNTKEELDKKKEAVEWVKKLQEETKKYADLVNSKIPSVTDQFNELNNTIRKTEESMLSTVRDEIVDGLKKELEKKKEEELEANEKAKKTAIDELEEKEKKIKKEIADLEDSTQDKQKKLDKLRTELMRWQKDDSPLAKKKIADLNEKISSLEKDVKKDDLNKQLSDIDEEKKAKSDYYSDLKDETEKSYKSQLEDKALYEKADKMLTAKSMDEIVELLKTYSTSYKDIGTLLGKNMGDAIKAQVEESIKSLEDLTGQKITKGTGTGTTGGTGSDSGSSSSSSEDAKAKKNWWELGKGDNVWIRQPKTPVYTDSSGTDVTGQTWWDSGVGSEDKLYIVDSKNGLSELSRDKSGNGVVGWIPRSLLAQYDTGGKTPANMNPNGELGILHPNEKILNSDMTKRFEALEDMAMAFKPMLSGISNMANIIQASKQLISGLSSSEESSVEIQNTYNVTNNTPFDTKVFGNNLESKFKSELRRYGKL